MSLFGKKKKTVDPVSILEQNGYTMNDGTAPENKSRKDRVADAAAARQSEVKKDNIIEAFTALRRELMLNDGYEGRVDQMEDMIARLRRMDEINDKTAMRAIDALILRTAKAVLDQCHRKNYLGVGEYVDVLEGYLNDRASDETCYYYKDERFLKFIAEKNRYDVLLSVQEAALMQKHREMEQLQADAKNPALHLPTDMVVRKASKIKAEAEAIKARIADAENKAAMLRKSLEQIKTNLDHTANKDNFDIMTDMEDVFALKHENDADSTMTDKFNTKLDQVNKKVLSSTLVVDNSAFNSTSSAPVELNDDLFKL